MLVSSRDREILRELGSRVAEIAALPVQQETIRRWKAINVLRPERPMVMVDQLPWHELDVDGSLVLQTEDSFCRGIEQSLRRKIYQWEHARADMVVEPYLDVPKVILGAEYGLSRLEELAVTDPENDVVGHHYIDQLRTEEDLDKIRMPEVALDEEATANREAVAHEIFDGILTVRMQGMIPDFAIWDRIPELHGVGNVINDLIDRPEFLHAIMARMTDFSLTLVDQLEEQGLLGYGQNTIHCSGAFTDELPAPGFTPERPRARDLWACGMAQLFSTVSPAMHQEFELDYVTRIYERFGLVYYGCCEPLQHKIGIIRAIPHLRKISISPFADVAKSAAEIGSDYVMSRKPSPAFLATTSWDPAAVEADLRETLSHCRAHGTPVEFILKDVSTTGYQPQRVWEWAEIAMQVVNE